MHARDPITFPRTARNAYYMDPIDALRLNRLADEGFAFAVIYHSHPNAGAYFSETDRGQALIKGEPAYPGAVYVVVSVVGREVKALAAYRWNAERRVFDRADAGDLDPAEPAVSRRLLAAAERRIPGRDLLVKFDGCYHGHADSLLVKAGSGGATFGIPDSRGVPSALAALTLTLPFNDLEAVRALFGARGSEIAALIVEPVAGNMGVVAPAPGFLAGLREVTAQHGALLIFDEVITGFRVAYGGAQELYGVRPDLTCLGKIIGGGLPVGAYGGRRDGMDHVAPLGGVYQAGTLSGNPLAVAAGLATLRALEDGQGYARLEALGARLERGLRDAAGKAGVPFTINRV